MHIHICDHNGEGLTPAASSTSRGGTPSPNRETRRAICYVLCSIYYIPYIVYYILYVNIYIYICIGERGRESCREIERY